MSKISLIIVWLTMVCSAMVVNAEIFTSSDLKSNTLTLYIVNINDDGTIDARIKELPASLNKVKVKLTDLPKLPEKYLKQKLDLILGSYGTLIITDGNWSKTGGIIESDPLFLTKDGYKHLSTLIN